MTKLRMLVVSAGVGLSALATQAVSADGEAVYNSGCLACHMTGVAGAPKVGDVEAWAPRIEQGIELLYERAIQGFQGATGVMPAKGGFAHLSDEDVMAAVNYMVSNSQ